MRVAWPHTCWCHGLMRQSRVPGRSVAPGLRHAEARGRIPPHAARSGEGLQASGQHLAPVAGPGGRRQWRAAGPL